LSNELKRKGKVGLSLDVGSGHNPRCDVNVDISSIYADYSPNFIKADACYLPFRRKSFVETTCFHVIEHTKNPLLLIRELIRVTDGVVTIKTPYRNVGHRRTKKVLFLGARLGYPHLWSFRKSWFAPLQKWFPKTEIEYSNFFIIPTEITVIIDTCMHTRVRKSS